MMKIIKVFRFNYQKYNHNLQIIQDFNEYKKLMNKFEHKTKRKDTHSIKSSFIYQKFNTYDNKLNFLMKFSIPFSSYSFMKKFKSML